MAGHGVVTSESESDVTIKIKINLKQDLTVLFNCCLSVVLSLDEGDYPENVKIVCLCHNK